MNNDHSDGTKRADKGTSLKEKAMAAKEKAKRSAKQMPDSNSKADQKEIAKGNAVRKK